MLALALVVVAAILLLVIIYLRRKSPAVLRRIEAYERLNHVIGLAVENGTRLHISLDVETCSLLAAVQPWLRLPCYVVWLKRLP